MEVRRSEPEDRDAVEALLTARTGDHGIPLRDELETSPKVPARDDRA
jgi:hypothetical protein